MRSFGWLILLGLLFIDPSPAASGDAPVSTAPEWAMNATLIEACSCPMFCQCFFTDVPAKHHDHATGKVEHFCRANIAMKINRGHYGETSLDGAVVWMAGDLGDRLSDGPDWLVVTFDPSVGLEQRNAIAAILSHVYPAPAREFALGKDAAIEWKANADRAVAMLDGGKAGEIVLKRFQGMSDEPVVIRNLRYVGAPRNEGFVLMPSQIEAYRLGERAFEFRDTNGFMVTIDITSKDVEQRRHGM